MTSQPESTVMVGYSMLERVHKATSCLMGNMVTSEAPVRTLIHAILFHYEYFWLPVVNGKPPVRILSGPKECTHGNDCAYLFANALFISRLMAEGNIMPNGCDVGCGCSFSHVDAYPPVDFVDCCRLMTVEVLVAIDKVYTEKRSSRTATRRFLIPDSRRPEGNWRSLSVFNDDIFNDVVKAGEGNDVDEVDEADKQFPGLLDIYADKLEKALTQ